MTALTLDERAQLEAKRAELVAMREEMIRARVPEVEIEITGQSAGGDPRPRPSAGEALLAKIGQWQDAPAARERRPEDVARVIAEIDKALVEPPKPVVFRVPTLGELGAGDSWLDNPPPKAPVLLTGAGGAPFMRDGKVALLVAPGATGKTFALIQLAVAIATGTPWLKTYGVARKGRVLLALGEEDADEVRRRLWQVVKMLDLGPYERDELARNVHPLGLAGESVAFLGRTSDKNMGPTAWFETFRAALEAESWRCIILDPWSRWGGPDAETDAHAATIGVTLLERLTKLPGNPAVIVAHHERKRSRNDKSRSDASDTRGSSALVDGARLVMNLGAIVAELLELRATKTNYTIAGQALALARAQGGPLRPATPAERAALAALDESASEGERKTAKAPRRSAAKAESAPVGSGDREEVGADA